MRMEHDFTVPVPVDQAWSALLDPERVAPCMPGASLTSAEGNEFAGSVKVKLGPVSLLYKGSGSFTEIDEQRRNVVIDASGKDSRGNGTASATVTATMASADSGTSVHVETDLKVTGKPAQLGRGLISDVAGKLINQFADCLAQRLAGAATGAQPGDAQPASREASQAASTETGTAGRTTAETGAATTTSGTSWQVTAAESDQRTQEAGRGEASTNGSGAAPTGLTEQPTGGDTTDSALGASNESVDLLGAAWMPVLKRLGPALAGVGALTLLFMVLRRKRAKRRS